MQNHPNICLMNSQKCFFDFYLNATFMAVNGQSKRIKYKPVSLAFPFLYHVSLITFKLATYAFELSIFKMNVENIQNFFIAWVFLLLKQMKPFSSSEFQELCINIFRICIYNSNNQLSRQIIPSMVWLPRSIPSNIVLNIEKVLASLI